jgi:hypothetical protein
LAKVLGEDGDGDGGRIGDDHIVRDGHKGGRVGPTRTVDRREIDLRSTGKFATARPRRTDGEHEAVLGLAFGQEGAGDPEECLGREVACHARRHPRHSLNA